MFQRRGKKVSEKRREPALFVKCQSELNQHIEKLDGEFQEAKSEKAQRIAVIRKARGGLLGRSTLFALMVGFVGFGVEVVRPCSLSALRDLLPSGTLTTVVTSVVSSLVIMAVVFVIGGARSATLASAIESTIRARFKVYRTRRRQVQRLRYYVRDTVDALVRNISVTDLNLESIVVAAAQKWLGESSPSHKAALKELSGLTERVRRCTECLDEFGSVANQNMTVIPDELRESAESIRRDAVEMHMTLIREATEAVDNLRSDFVGFPVGWKVRVRQHRSPHHILRRLFVRHSRGQFRC